MISENETQGVIVWMAELQYKLVHRFSSVKIRELIGKEWNLEI